MDNPTASLVWKIIKVIRGVYMRKVFCLDDGKEYYFTAISGYDAIQKMLYTLNIAYKDDNVVVVLELCNERTWSLKHNGKTYACVM